MQNNGEQLRNYAACFRLTADDLQHSLNKMDIKTMNETGDTNGLRKVAGYTFSIVILRAFAVECALKALAFKRKGAYRTDKDGHDLWILFEQDLDNDAKDLIAKIANLHGVAPLGDILKNHRSDFVDWRYPQGKAVHANFLDLDKALEVLMTAYTHKDFQPLGR